MSILHFRKTGLTIMPVLMPAMMPALLAGVLLTAALAAALLPAAALAAQAPGADATGITVKVNGEAIAFDVKPLIVDGRTLVPLRGVLEKLGARVDWAAATREAVVTTNGHVVRVRLGSKTATLDNKTVTMDVEARAIGGRTLVPLRFLSENAGARVIWVAAARTVEIIDVGKLTPEQKQLLEAFDNLQDARKANLSLQYSLKANGTDSQSLDIGMGINARAVINGNDSHVWMEMRFSGGDALKIPAPAQPMSMEMIRKDGRVYFQSGSDPWKIIDESALAIPLTITGDRDEEFLQYYNLPFKAQSVVDVNGQKVTEYSFVLDGKTPAEIIGGLSPGSAGAGIDEELFNVLKGMTLGNVSKKIDLDPQNRIVRDNASLNMSFQPPAPEQGEDQGLTGALTCAVTVESTYDYTGEPQPIAAPAGVAPGS